jgi:hypothetical protein
MCSLLKPGTKKKAQVQWAMRQLNLVARAVIAAQASGNGEKMPKLDRNLKRCAERFLKAKLGDIKAQRAAILSVPNVETAKAAEIRIRNLAELETDLTVSGVAGLIREALKRASENS